MMPMSSVWKPDLENICQSCWLASSSKIEWKCVANPCDQCQPFSLIDDRNLRYKPLIGTPLNVLFRNVIWKCTDLLHASSWIPHPPPFFFLLNKAFFIHSINCINLVFPPVIKHFLLPMATHSVYTIHIHILFECEALRLVGLPVCWHNLSLIIDKTTWDWLLNLYLLLKTSANLKSRVLQHSHVQPVVNHYGGLRNQRIMKL